ncbi:hypothetical protein P9K31_14245 [Corynebacterium glutamicum]|uniref:hypothetical protein n=1 Tax=Corynebacterium TaxID=1716 RepID=UPI000A620161|nr:MULTISPECIES: hypothetical protein [Corynebacterium]QJS17377.1 hypothetical protein HK412_14760 [Corynebacterium glutamicum]QXU45894.1 hypothetical protein KW808_00690 [[Brevibacterium] flavum]WFP71575.1 hypothetical protein P9K31_14245 [Corynebacterium glutamicum]
MNNQEGIQKSMVTSTVTSGKVVPTSQSDKRWALKWEWFQRTGLKITGQFLER